MPERSDKLKQICLYLKNENIPFNVKQFNYQSIHRFRCYVAFTQYIEPIPFPRDEIEQALRTKFITTISDELERESANIPIPGCLLLRIKGHRKGSAIQGWVTRGNMEISDIRRVDILKHPDVYDNIQINGYLDAEDTISKE